MRMRKFLLHVKNGFFMIAMFVALAGGLSLASCSGDTPGNEDDGELTDGTGGGGGDEGEILRNLRITVRISSWESGYCIRIRITREMSRYTMIRIWNTA